MRNRGSRKVSKDSSRCVPGGSKELARGIYRSAGRSRCGLLRRSNNTNSSSSATIKARGEPNKGEISKREVSKDKVNQGGSSRLAADSRSRESGGSPTRSSTGI